MKKIGICEVSKNTRMVYQRLAMLAEGAIVKYEELSAIVGGDIQRAFRSNLDSARSMIEREDGIVTTCVRKVGIKRVARGELATVGETSIKRARKTAHRGARSILRGVQKTPPQGEALTRAMVMASVNGAIAEMGSTRRIEAVVAATGNATQEMNFTDTMKLFSNK